MRYKRTYIWSPIIIILIIYFINYDPKKNEFDDNDVELKTKLDSKSLNNEELNISIGSGGNVVTDSSAPDSGKYYVWKKEYLKENGYWNFRNFTPDEIGNLSVLGRRLFLHEDVGLVQQTPFLIYVYKFGPRLEKRLINHYTKRKADPFENCSVSNCKISYNHSDFHSADAVLFHLHKISQPPTELQRTNFNQRWVWMSDESIFHTFLGAKDKQLSHYDNFFNWSMTYRPESDVPVPYGRVVPLINHPTKQNLDIFSKKNKTIAILGSNCSGRNGRWNYVKILEKYINIDTYGHCGKLKCPGHFNKDCTLLNSYKFYLAFENSNCKDYITEKTWWNAFEKESVPVVMGATKSNYEKLLPPNSFIHVDDFNSPQQLADYIRLLSSNKDLYNKYHAWRANYKVVNEHGYFQSEVYHYCRLCEALNYNSPYNKIYKSMESFWNLSRDCNNIKYPK